MHSAAQQVFQAERFLDVCSGFLYHWEGLVTGLLDRESPQSVV